MVSSTVTVALTVVSGVQYFVNARDGSMSRGAWRDERRPAGRRAAHRQRAARRTGARPERRLRSTSSLAARGARVYAPARGARRRPTASSTICASLLADEPDLLVVSGGLGTTHDDLTTAAVARGRWTRPRRRTPQARRMVEERTRRSSRAARWHFDRGARPTQALKQARLPEGSRALPPAGAAPGFTLRVGGTQIVVLPGVPAELEVDVAARRSTSSRPRGSSRPSCARTVRIYGAGEMQVVPLLESRCTTLLDVGVTASDGEVTVCAAPRRWGGGRGAGQSAGAGPRGGRCPSSRPTAAPSTSSSPTRCVPPGATRGRRRVVHRGPARRPADGGRWQLRLLHGGVISYANQVKEIFCACRRRRVAPSGAVSAEVALGDGRRSASPLTGATYGLAATGVAGPGGGTDDKPVGLVYIACAGPRALDVPAPRSSAAAARRCAAGPVTAALHLLREAIGT